MGNGSESHTVFFRVKKEFFDQYNGGVKRVEIRLQTSVWTAIQDRLAKNWSQGHMIAIVVCGRNVRKYHLTGMARNLSRKQAEKELGYELTVYDRGIKGPFCAFYIGEPFGMGRSA